MQMKCFGPLGRWTCCLRSPQVYPAWLRCDFHVEVHAIAGGHELLAEISPEGVHAVQSAIIQAVKASISKVEEGVQRCPLFNS
jgi:hypothetical protein